MKETESGSGLPGTRDRAGIPVPEEPFGIRHRYWKTGVVLFSFALLLVTCSLLLAGGSPLLVGSLYVIPAVLLAYFFRRKGALGVFLLAMFFFTAVVVFRYPSIPDVFAAAILAMLLIATALFVSSLTAHLVREKRKYHAIFENTENGVILVRLSDHRILEQNQRFASALGLAPEEAGDKTIDDYVAGKGSLAQLFSALEARCAVPATETGMLRADGTMWTAVIAARKIAAGSAVLTFIDVTERRRLDEELRKCNADSSLYLDILTHDINNITTAAMNYAGLLDAAPPESREELVRKLESSLDKTEEIIRNISTLRKMQLAAPHMTPVHLSYVIRKEIAAYPETRIEYDGGDAVVMADEMLSSVFNNLIGNSVKYGGTEPRVTISVRTAGPDAEVTIGDNGSGIPDNLKPLVFERFQRGDTTVSGKGLGLFICRSLIERYGGWIRVEDQVSGDPSQGTLMRFVIPRVRDGEA